MKNSVQSWSWQSIQSVYRTYGILLGQYAAIDQRIHVPKQMHISLPDDNNLFILRFWADVERIDSQLKCLDQEIARRNNLIGVMG